MAENHDGQEKSFEPSARRLDEAKRRGQVPRSRELNTVAVTLAGVAAIVLLGDRVMQDLRGLVVEHFALSRADVFDPAAVLRHLGDALTASLLILAPFFAVTVAAAMLASVALGGVQVSTEALRFDLGKLSPLQGMKRILSLHGLAELVKALAKFVFLGGVAALLVWTEFEHFVRLATMEVDAALAETADLLGWTTLVVASSAIVLAMVDVPFQLWDYKRQLKMTQQEVRDELKDTEGRPEVRSRIRQLQREVARRRMMEEVPKADVIVTNPTHYAVALRYDAGRMQAPVLVAKGTELVAANIRKVGQAHAVPVVEAPALARSLYFNVELGDPIPAGLYLAVAKLLAYVFQLRTVRQQGGSAPDVPDFPVPDELRRE
jgi:flagellar biosynthetic protein FlhB